MNSTQAKFGRRSANGSPHSAHFLGLPCISTKVDITKTNGIFARWQISLILQIIEDGISNGIGVVWPGRHVFNFRVSLSFI